ncbi:anti-sigma factor family protein [Acidovorax sp. NPDC077693]|uniref:anti-sigma factor family protein n=1 Tax=unclassified Acidovorax TaxID=2684926 RepID=UPI0037C86F81
MFDARQPAMDHKHHPPPPPADGDEAAAWHALVDGRLPPAQAAALRDKLERQAGAEETVAHWQHQRQQLRTLHQSLLTEPVPDALLAAAQRASVRQQRHTQWWRWGGMAASVLVAFALGWTGRSLVPDILPGVLPGMARLNAPAPTPALAATGQHFAQQAAVAHAVYQPEVRHAVEVPAAQQEHLVQWLSKRLSRPLKLPVLADEGYELVGGRLLPGAPGDAGARAQFMYQNAQGGRITLYLGAVAAGQPGAATAAPKQPDAAETAFQFSSDGPVPSFYWVDQGFGYALSGQLSRQQLLVLASAVYKQL